MKTPVANYDMVENTVNYSHLPNVVWAGILDRRYKLEVISPPVPAVYTTYDSCNNDEVIYSEETTLSYGAIFGPDWADVDMWQRRACEEVDKL